MERALKAIVLLSGGLDSVLAAKLIQKLGVEVIALHFNNFFGTGNKDKYSQAEKAAQNLILELKVVDITEDFFKILEKPRHGFGSNLNPCIDCKILMLSKSRQLMPELGASFVVTGEVLGQRPMSQHKKALEIIEKESGLEGLVLRPLSARLLKETIPEQKGWIDRNKLMAISGRSRKPQVHLAHTLDVTDYPCAAGGCLLTDIQFTKRMRDLMAREKLNLNNVELLKIGRHFCISEKTRLVVGRDENENQCLERLVQEGDYLFMPTSVNGPIALGRGNFIGNQLQLSCSIMSRYCDSNGSKETEISYFRFPEKEQRIINIAALDEEGLVKLRI